MAIVGTPTNGTPTAVSIPGQKIAVGGGGGKPRPPEGKMFPRGDR